MAGHHSVERIQSRHRCGCLSRRSPDASGRRHGSIRIDLGDAADQIGRGVSVDSESEKDVPLVICSQGVFDEHVFVVGQLVRLVMRHASEEANWVTVPFAESGLSR